MTDTELLDYIDSHLKNYTGMARDVLIGGLTFTVWPNGKHKKPIRELLQGAIEAHQAGVAARITERLTE